MKKYDFTGKTIQHDDRTLHQIIRLYDNLIGGYIEKESNLSQSGDCFVFDNAKVYDTARVSGTARVFGTAEVFGNAVVYGNAEVSSNARISGNSWVCGTAWVSDNAEVSSNANVSGNAWVSSNAKVSDNAEVSGNANVFGNANVSQTPLTISGNLKHPITITETHIFIGCEGHTIEHWKRNIVAIGRNNGYTDAEIKQVIGYIKTTLQARKK